MPDNEEAPQSDLMLDAASLAAPRYIWPRSEEPEPGPHKLTGSSPRFGESVTLYSRFVDLAHPEIYVEWDEPIHADDGTYTGSKVQTIRAAEAVARICERYQQKHQTVYPGSSFDALRDFMTIHWARLVTLFPES